MNQKEEEESSQFFSHSANYVSGLSLYLRNLRQLMNVLGLYLIILKEFMRKKILFKLLLKLLTKNQKKLRR